jgi:hypothetical protein
MPEIKKQRLLETRASNQKVTVLIITFSFCNLFLETQEKANKAFFIAGEEYFGHLKTDGSKRNAINRIHKFKLLVDTVGYGIMLLEAFMPLGLCCLVCMFFCLLIMENLHFYSGQSIIWQTASRSKSFRLLVMAAGIL